jgi:arabinan endo-1,5-alpha-L-arabinosidase
MAVLTSDCLPPVDPKIGYAYKDFQFGFNYLDFSTGWPLVVS